MNEKPNVEEILEFTIKDALPHIFHRVFVYVTPKTSLKSAALFLVPLRKLFASGILVLNEGNLVGQIGPKQILQKFLEMDYPECFNLQVQDAMEKPIKSITINSPIKEVLKIFRDRKHAFIPIMKNDSVIATISIRDFLPLVTKLEIQLPIRTIASKLIFVSKGIDIKSALTIMLENDIRKLIIKNENNLEVIDVRSIIHFICSSEDVKTGLLKAPIENLIKSNIIEFQQDKPLSETAKIIKEKDLPCAIIEKEAIVTPRDLVMKTLGPYIAKTDFNALSLPE